MVDNEAHNALLCVRASPVQSQQPISQLAYLLALDSRLLAVLELVSQDVSQHIPVLVSELCWWVEVCIRHHSS
jgi:hypothetical protein